MNENERKALDSKESQERKSQSRPTSKLHPDQAGDRGDFSWYGGQVDEAVLRNIVRLKRAQKL